MSKPSYGTRASDGRLPDGDTIPNVVGEERFAAVYARNWAVMAPEADAVVSEVPIQVGTTDCTPW